LTLVFTSLGFSPLSGKKATDQCSVFRRQIRSVLEPPEGVSLLVVPDAERCEVRVAFEREDEKAQAWVREAEEVAGKIWASLSERRRGVVKD
jgi:hypothetical protein